MSTAALQHGSADFAAKAVSKIPPTSRADIDAAIETLAANKDAWRRVPPVERVALIEAVMDATLAAAPAWAAAGWAAKNLDPKSPRAGEEYLAALYPTMRNLRLLRDSLKDIVVHGRPRLPGKIGTRPGGQVVVPVFPTGLYDRLLYAGFSAEVWLEPGVTPEDVEKNQAAAYREPGGPGKVALVLAAGNVGSIGPMDAIYKLFVEDQVVLLKMNPVNEYLGPHFVRAFAPLFDRGFLRLVYGGAEEGAYLCEHPKIDEIHITGSDKTHDAIVYGVGAEGKKRKAERKPRLDKRITSELGNVSPVIVVPGPWSEADIRYQGENIASMLTNNAGFNCNALRVLVTHAGWSKREALIGAIEDALRRAPARSAYYPGAADRWEAFVGKHPEAHLFGERKGDELPWTLIPNLDPAKNEDICFQVEAFCGVAGETPLPAANVREFIEKAAAFCNDRVWGSLNAAIIAHPLQTKDSATGEAIEKAIADLRYGTVGVNHWPALSYAMACTTWGAFPGHALHDIGSGIGSVHNTYMLPDPQKSVLRGPFRVMPKPPWFVTHRTAHELGPKLVELEHSPSPLKMPGIIATALRG
ncbi:aldehyde dehydrogenase family protein [bacterium]|nr:aldehyde dehydrogenase family protein [bacterium]